MNGLVSILFFSSLALLSLSFGGAYQQAVTGDLMVGLALGGFALGALAFIFGLTTLVFRPRGQDSGQGEVGIVTFLALLYGMAILGGGGYLYVSFAKKYPFINDVTTDTDLPPEFRGSYPAFFVHEGQGFVSSRTARVYDPSFPPLQAAGYADIKPRMFNHPPDVIFRAAVVTASSMPRWRITHSEPEKLHIEIEAETEVLHFIDDIAIEVRATPAGSVLHMRSRSRAGRFDFGVNAERIRNFYSRIDTGVEKILARDKAKAAAANPPPTAAPTTSPPVARAVGAKP